MPQGRGDPGGSGPDPGDPRPVGYELLEHTADVGIRARGPTLETAFEQATEGLADVLGALAPGWSPGGSEPREAVAVRVGDGTAAGWVGLSGDGPAPDGTFVKAVTYHRLRVEPDPGGGWLIEVYLDV